VKTGTRYDLAVRVGWKGDFIPGPGDWTARLHVSSVEPQSGGLPDADRPLKVKPNQSVELRLEQSVTVPRTYRLHVEVHEALHAAGIVRTRATWEAGEEVRIYFTAQRAIDLADLAWIMQVRARPAAD
jgi:hypothetical protein